MKLIQKERFPDRRIYGLQEQFLNCLQVLSLQLHNRGHLPCMQQMNFLPLLFFRFLQAFRHYRISFFRRFPAASQPVALFAVPLPLHSCAHFICSGTPSAQLQSLTFFLIILRKENTLYFLNVFSLRLKLPCRFESLSSVKKLSSARSHGNGLDVFLI